MLLSSLHIFVAVRVTTTTAKIAARSNKLIQKVDAFKISLIQIRKRLLILSFAMDMILPIVIKNTKTDEELELTYQQICDKIKDAQWVFLLVVFT